MTTQDREDDRILFSKADVARRTGLDPKTVDAEITDGRLRVTKIRRRKMIHRDDLRAWLDGCRLPTEGTHDAA